MLFLEYKNCKLRAGDEWKDIRKQWRKQEQTCSLQAVCGKQTLEVPAEQSQV